MLPNNMLHEQTAQLSWDLRMSWNVKNLIETKTNNPASSCSSCSSSSKSFLIAGFVWKDDPSGINASLDQRLQSHKTEISQLQPV